MPMKSKEMVKLLENNGFRFIRQKGSHAIYHNSATRKTVIVPM
ncbi:MAG: type II toxin-antitoxin system HicA family toxin, partial [Ruminococcus sp.]|nr:type II toxin-antitoxin system HicA family toxin [Ruminococcus sp.]